MNWFKLINSFYPKYWTKEMVADAVICEKLTDDQYKKITEEAYVE